MRRPHAWCSLAQWQERRLGGAGFVVMPVRVKPIPFLAVTAMLLAIATAAQAQNTTDVKPLPGLDDFNLPSSRPRPVVPTPEPTISALPRRDASSDRPAAERVQPPPVVPTARATPAVRPAVAPRAAPGVVRLTLYGSHRLGKTRNVIFLHLYGIRVWGSLLVWFFSMGPR